MAISNGLRDHPSDHDLSTGLMACGSSGAWTIDIDATTSGIARYFARIENPFIYLSFEITSLTVINEAIEFFAEVESKNDRSGTLVLSDNNTTQVRLIRDDEFADRFFLVIESEGGTVVHLTIAEDHLAQLTDALRRVREEVSAE